MSSSMDAVAEEYQQTWSGRLADYFEQFIRSYSIESKIDPQSKNQIKKYLYLDQISSMRLAKGITKDDKGHFELGTAIFYLNFEDLVIAETKGTTPTEAKVYQMMQYAITNDYTHTKDAIKSALFRIIHEIQPDYADYCKENLTISITNFSKVMEIADLSAFDLDRFRKVEGVLTQFDSDKRIKIISTVWKCINCDVENARMGGAAPDKCFNCREKSFEEVESKRKAEDFIYVQIQQRGDKLKEGIVQAPTLDAYFMGTELRLRMMQRLEPGLYVGINGTVRMTDRSRQNPDEVSIELEGSSMEVMPEHDLFATDASTQRIDELVRAQIQRVNINDHFDKLVRSVCPHLEGLEEVKLAILLQLAGSDSKYEKGLNRVRGEINILLLGDSSVGKTEALKFVWKTRTRSNYAIGKGASEVGLTAGIASVKVTRKGVTTDARRIAFGTYAISNGGIVCLDELEKRKEEDFQGISHCMDDYQEINLDKVGIHQKLYARCGSLHAANPITNFGKYDKRKTLWEQTNFANWLFSRYDLIFILVDDNDPNKRKRMWDRKEINYATVRIEDTSGGNGKANKTTEIIDEDFGRGRFFIQSYLRRELIYLRQAFHPVLKPGTAAWNAMKAFWDRYNQVNLLPQIDKEDNLSESAGLHIPALDNRKINTLVRLAEASARLHRRNDVTMEDMAISMGLVERSIGQIIPERSIPAASESAGRMVQHAVITIPKQYMKVVNQEIKEMLSKTLQFSRYLHHITFERCKMCKGTGKMKLQQSKVEPFPKLVTCTNCRGTKGTYASFGFSIANRINDELKYGREELQQIWETLEHSEIIAPTKGDRYIMIKDPTDPDFKTKIKHWLYKLTGQSDLEEGDEQGAVGGGGGGVIQPHNKLDASINDEVTRELQNIDKDPLNDIR